MEELVLICVLYNPSQECIDKWRSYTEWMPNCIFVDNSVLKSNQYNLPYYISLQSNLGITKAQNIGIEESKRLGFKYICFFDQDSKITPELVDGLLNEYKSLKFSGIKIGAIGPSLQEISTGKLYKGSESCSDNPKEVGTLISSGTLTEESVLDEVGLLNDRLFIDLVDHEWCWRAKSKGYKLFMSSKNILQHQVGKKTIKFLGYPILISAPFRYYYQYRNTIWLIKCNYAPSAWKWKAFVRKSIEISIIPFYTGDFILTLKNILKGIISGIKQKL